MAGVIVQLWLVAAFASALFAGIVSILAKCGIKTIDSDVATALRTCVVAAFTWLMVAIVGSASSISAITPRSWLFLALSGMATGASWICYFRALSTGDVNRVVPIDKSSTLMAVLLSIVLFGETGSLALRLAGTMVATMGTILMIERRTGDTTCDGRDDRTSLAYALAAAVFAALTSVLAKVGIEGVESNLATAIRTMFVLAMAWGIVVARGKAGLVRDADHRELAFLGASGVATGASWLCYYYAIQNGAVSVVVPIDKMSILVTVVLSFVFFREKLGKRALLGLALMLCGTLAMAIWS